MNGWVSTQLDIFANLAMEEALLERAARERSACIFFCVNRPCVVLGRNQNPWRETDPACLRGEGIALARRITGGGTVYHDEGNLNYSLIVPRDRYRREEIFDAALAALREVGVEAVRTGTHSLTAAGRKFSGSAFCFRRNMALHHGTLLVRSDLHALARSLAPAAVSLNTKAVASVRADVINLSEVEASLDFATLQAALAHHLAGWWGEEPCEIRTELPELDDLPAIEERLRSSAWIFGESPAFSLLLAGEEGVQGDIRVEQGCLVHVAQTLPGASLLAGAGWSREVLMSRLADAPERDRTWWAGALDRLF